MACYVKDHGSRSNIMQGYNSFDNHDDGKHGNKSIEFPVLSSSPSNHQSGQRQFLNGNSPNISNSYPTKKNVISVDDAIEQLGMGGFQTRLLFALGLCFAADAMEILLLSFLAPVLEVEMDLTPNQTAFVTSVVFCGGLLGTLILGPLGDIRGRRPTYLGAASCISFFGIATAFTSNYIPLLIARFFVGFGVGGLTVPFDTLAEFLPTSQRGSNLLYIEYFWTGGTLLVPPIAYWTLGGASQAGGIGSWQLFCFMCAIPCLISTILGYFFVPESPRWLCEQGRSKEALQILQEAALLNGHSNPQLIFPDGLQLVADGIDVDATQDEKFVDNNSNDGTRSHHHQTSIYSSATNFSLLLSKKWRSLSLNLWGLWFTFSIGYYGTILSVSRVFFVSSSSSEGGEGGQNYYEDSDNSQESDRAYDFNYISIFESCAGEVAGLTLVIFTIDRVGRIPSQIATLGCAGICVSLLCILSDPSIAAQWQVPHSALVVLAFLARAFEMSASCVAWTGTAEMLATEIRTTGHSAANAVARIGAMTIPFLVAESTPLKDLGIFMLVAHGIAMFCTSRLPETKGKAMGANATDKSIATSKMVDGDYSQRELSLI